MRRMHRRICVSLLSTVRHSVIANGVLNPILFRVANLGKDDAPESKLRLFGALSLDRTYH